MPRQRLRDISKKVVLIKLRPEPGDRLDLVISEQLEALLLNVLDFVLGLEKLAFASAQRPTCVVVKVIQELAFPIIPHLWTRSSHVSNSKQIKVIEPLLVTYLGCKLIDHFGI